MKILFLGDYSNLHACLSEELRKRGHEVTLVSDGSRYMQTACDIMHSREPGLKGSIKYLSESYTLISELKGFDVVQLINPGFIHLRPEKLKFFFNKLLKNNGSVFLTLAGDDYYFVKACGQSDIFRFSEYRVWDTFTEMGRSAIYSEWLNDDLKAYTEYLYNHIDGAMSVLPEYDMVARELLGDKVAYTGIPINLENHPYMGLDLKDGLVNVFIGMKMEYASRKGTDRLYAILQELEKEMPDRCKLTKVSNVSIAEYYNLMKPAHIVVDQLYAYSPATNALAAMAMGKVAATGAMPEYYHYIGDDYDKPIIKLSPLDPDLKETLRSSIINWGELFYKSLKGRKLVEKNNDVTIVADRFINHWNKSLLDKK